jgi:hypothetical protein
VGLQTLADCTEITSRPFVELGGDASSFTFIQ